MRPVLRSHPALVGFAVPALLLGLAACGGTEVTPVAGESAESVAATSPQGTWDEESLVPAMLAAIEKQETAHVTMSAVSEGMNVDAEGDLALRGRQPEAALTMDGAALGVGEIEVRLVDEVLYVSVPPMTPKGKFLEIRPGDKSSLFGGMGGMGTGMPGMDQMDPRDAVAAFEAGLKSVRFLGEESVQGDEVEHYRLTVDPRAAAKGHDLPRRSDGPRERGPWDNGMPRNADLPRTAVFDLWVDEDALPRRVELDARKLGMHDRDSRGPGEPKKGTVVVEMSAWGEPVTIQAPAGKDIVEAPGWGTRSS